MYQKVANKLRSKYWQRYFKRMSQAVRNTPKAGVFDDTSDLVLLSMVQKKDVDMYLIAVKSFLQYCKPNKVVVVADPSIDDEAEAILHEHIGKLEIRKSADFHSSGIPQGGCWERITAIADYNPDFYVIQLDADTVTLNAPELALSSFRQNKPFVLATDTGPDITDLDFAVEYAKSRIITPRPHIQLLAEAALNDVSLAHSRYIRGCAGFAGYARGTITRSRLEAVCQEFYRVLGERWNEWGTEQFTSNLLLANAESTEVLPIDAYVTPINAHEGIGLPEIKNRLFVHFIGSVRYKNALYADTANYVIRRM